MATGAARPRGTTIRFGRFGLDLSRQILSRSGTRLKLQKQPFAVLALLIQRAPDIVTREEITLHVWGNDVYVDSKQGINFCIRQIRSVLEDSSTSPSFVETVPRQGYRFIAPLEGLLSQTEVQDKSPVRRWLMAGAAIITGIVLAAGSWLWFARRDTAHVVGVVRISPVTTYPGDESQPSLSRDGRQVVFSWGGEKSDNRDIYITFLGEQHPVRLTTDPAEDAYAAWSPDAKHIAFIRRRGGTKADIILIPASGGPERILRRIRLNAWMTNRMLAWSPDGKWLCFTNEVGTSGRHMLFLLSPESGVVRQLSPEQDNGLGDSSPAFSPDGRWLAFGRFIYPGNSKLLLQRLSSDFAPQGKPLEVKEAGVNPKAPVWMPDGRRVLFLDGSRIMQAAIGGVARPFYVSRSIFGELTLAGPGTGMVASLQNKDGDIWTIPLGRKGLAATGTGQPMVHSTAEETQPRFSPDGRSLAFRSDRSGTSEIWLADSDGQNPRQLTHLSAYIAGYPRWSPDGRFLVFHARLPWEPQVHVVRVEDGVTRQVTDSSPGFTAPSWSMDGQTIYTNAVQSGENNIYSVSATDGTPRLLWEGTDPIEAPGRRLLIYDKEDKPGIYARSLDGDPAKNPERLLVTDFMTTPRGGFYPVDDGIYYSSYDLGGVIRAFRFYSFDSGKSVDIAPAPASLNSGITVTPDRTRLAYSTRSSGNEDLVWIELK